MNVPAILDGAKVILYTTNDISNNFGCVHYEEHDEVVTGLAIAKYDSDESYYLFSCDLQWNVIGDTLHATLEEAKCCAENSFEIKGLTWRTKQ